MNWFCVPQTLCWCNVRFEKGGFRSGVAVIVIVRFLEFFLGCFLPYFLPGPIQLEFWARLGTFLIGVNATHLIATEV